MNLIDVSSETASQGKRGVPALLTEAALRQLVGARAVTEITAVGGETGFVVALKLGEGEALLGNSQGRPRLFASIGTIALLLQRLGHFRFTVDATNFVPGRIRPAQPERSASMLSGKLHRSSAKQPVSKKKAGQK